MFSVPMGLIGVVAVLLATGTTLNIESFMGTIVMVGIVVSNSILLVDFANQRRREGAPLRRAIVEASRIRMRPIVMTALATVVGLLPIALKLGEGSEASAPLARAAVGGLAVSTVLTLVLVPGRLRAALRAAGGARMRRVAGARRMRCWPSFALAGAATRDGGPGGRAGAADGDGHAPRARRRHPHDHPAGRPRPVSTRRRCTPR